MAYSQFYYGATGAGADHDFTLHGSAMYYQEHAALLTNQNNQLGYMLLNRSFASDKGVTVEFDFKQYGNPASGLGDGMVVFLIDGEPSGFTQGGAKGAGLGFTDEWSGSAYTGLGAKPTYLGVGLGRQGVFASNLGGTSGNRSGTGGIASPALNSFALRTGSVVDSRKYFYLASTGAQNPVIAYGTNMNYRPLDGTYYRRYRVEFKPNGTGFIVTVSALGSAGAADYSSPVLTYDYSDLNGSLDQSAFRARPAIMSVGFIAASPSGRKSYTEVRNVVVRTPGDLWVKRVMPDCVDAASPVVTSIVNNGRAVPGIEVHDTLPAGFVPRSPQIIGGKFAVTPTSTPASGGRTAYYYKVDAPLRSSEIKVIWPGRYASIPSGGVYNTSVRITPPGGTSDSDLSDNYSAVSGTGSFLIPVTPDEPNTITVLRPGLPPTFEVAANSALSLNWEYSLDNGNTWIFEGINAETYTAPEPLSYLKSLLVRCTANWASGTCQQKSLLFRCVAAPDNVVDPSLCTSPPSPMVFNIREIARSPGGPNVSPLSTPVIGDIDSDGETEIIVFKGQSATNWAPYDYILIYGYRKQPAGLYHKYSIDVRNTGFFPFDRIAIAKVDGSNYASLFYADGQGKIRKYEFADSLNSSITYPSATSWVAKWTTADLLGGNLWHSSVSPNVVDIAGNGRTQVVYNDKIIDTRSGNIIADGKMIPAGLNYNWAYTFGRGGHRDENTNGAYMSVPVLIDIDNDGIKEVVAGNCVYGVTLVDFDNASTANKYFLKQKARPTTPDRYEIREGFTAVADLDLDGQLEVIVTGTIEPAGNLPGENFSSGTEGFLYVWDPRTGAVLNSNQLARGSGFNRQGTHGGPSRPFIGDVDGDGLPEISFSSALKLHCFRFDTITRRLEYKWTGLSTTDKTMTTNDRSASTTLTMFDFAHDGKQRLIYRDEEKLHIIDASGTTPSLTTIANVFSYTGNEYPVVADVNGDGAAEIIVTGGTTNNAAGHSQGYVMILASNGRPWAPARKVWNQSAYNSINVNDDLTIPQHAISPAQTFLSVSHTTGNDTILRPYNGFLMQQGPLDHSGRNVWITPDASIKVFNIIYATDQLTLNLEIENKGSEALVSPLYIAIYRNGAVFQTATLDETVYPGETKTKSIVMPLAGTLLTDAFTLTLNDRGDGQGWVQLECNYDNNSKGFRRVMGADDAATVQAWHTITIDALANDGFTTLPPTLSLCDSVILAPRNGDLMCIGTGPGAKFIYKNTGTTNLSPGEPIDSFRYRIRPAGVAVVHNPTVYIYILQDENGGNACSGPIYTAKLKVAPSGTKFDWHDAPTGGSLLAANTNTLDIPAASFVDEYWKGWIYPYNVGTAARPWNLAGGFPRGELSVHTAGISEQMRWTGHIDNNWNNPGNWVVVHNRSESPVSYAPGLCTDVTIPASVNNFPELTDTARCNNILMLDRAMLKNPHVLKYTAASVEIKLKAPERDRFVMWSAPLKAIYSGDYHYRQGNTLAGDAFMNLFQINNPDPGHGSAVVNRFTSTFANPNAALPLGTAFSLKVVSSTVTRDSLLRFPSSETGYANPPAPTPTLDRTGAGRFITDGYEQEIFNLTVSGSLAGASLVQVVNPYMAYLDMTSFLGNADNSNLISNGYYIWDGEVGSSLLAHAFANAEGDQNNRIVASSAISLTTSPGYIAPLQSFFVVRKNTAGTLGSLKMSRAWTTTKPVDSYTLRSSIKSGGVLNIILSGANKQAGAALIYEPGTTNFATDKIDMPAVTYTIDNEVPLSVYTFSANLSPLMINASSSFDMLPVGLGLIAQEPGEYSLSFEGLYNCGYDVTLADLALDKRIELKSASGEYSFTLARPHGSTSIEVNDRFKLYLKYTGNGIISAAEDVKASPLRVRSEAGYINVSAGGQTISSLQVYDAYGRTVYSSMNSAGAVRIPVAGGIYLVKAGLGNEQTVTRVFVK
jgi:hypothetical protein